MSFKNDLVCLLKTIPVILKQDGFVEGATASLAHQEVAVTEEAN